MTCQLFPVSPIARMSDRGDILQNWSNHCTGICYKVYSAANQLVQQGNEEMHKLPQSTTYNVHQSLNSQFAFLKKLVVSLFVANRTPFLKQPLYIYVIQWNTAHEESDRTTVTCCKA